MIEIYLIRHGECQGNREGLFRGRFDFPLNENGVRQAEHLQQALREVRFSAIYTGPLSRAYRTAEILSAGRFPVRTEKGFNNIALGDWENTPKAEVQRKFPELWKLWTTRPEKLHFPGMEPLSEVRHRSYRALKDIIKSHRNETIGVVTHRAVIKPLVAAILNIPEPYFWKVHIDTAAYGIIEFREGRGFTVTLWNETHHLQDFIREDLG